MIQPRALITLTLGLAMTAPAAGQSSVVQKHPPLPVSLIRIIANPERFANQVVRVAGFLDYGGGLDENVCLYVSELDARNLIMSNCVPLRTSIEKSDKRFGRYVILNAYVHYIKANGINDFVELEHVSEMNVWPNRPPS